MRHEYKDAKFLFSTQKKKGKNWSVYEQLNNLVDEWKSKFIIIYIQFEMPKPNNVICVNSSERGKKKDLMITSYYNH